uniref:Uncharacterized protein n=1 Tax=Arundo donax TaxID=35708 RepID=A0A0A8Z3J1_ARUDO
MVICGHAIFFCALDTVG